MDDREIHELAVAFAQAKFIGSQCKLGNPEDSDTEDIHNFLKDYKFALDNIQNEWDDIG